MASPGGTSVRTARVTRWFVVTAALVVPSLLATVAHADLAVSGDQAAWQELVAAVQLLNASSYRARVTVRVVGDAPVQVTDLSFEIVPPDKLHMTLQTPQGELEIVIVGDDSRFRAVPGSGGPGPWQCNPIRRDPSAASPTLPVNILISGLGTRNVSRGEDSEIHGTPVHTYLVTGTAPDPMRSDRALTYLPGTAVYVDAGNHLPVRIVAEYTISAGSASQRVTSIFDFSDYGAAIAIDLPPCD